MTKKRNLLFSFALLVLLSVPLLFDATALQVLRLKTFDVFVNEQSPSGNFVVLNITEEDVAKEGGWPFPRRRADSQGCIGSGLGYPVSTGRSFWRRY